MDCSNMSIFQKHGLPLSILSIYGTQSIDFLDSLFCREINDKHFLFRLINR